MGGSIRNGEDPTTAAVKIAVEQDRTNSLWYVWWGKLRLSDRGFRFHPEAEIYAEGYREGFRAATLAVLSAVQGLRLN